VVSVTDPYGRILGFLDRVTLQKLEELFTTVVCEIHVLEAFSLPSVFMSFHFRVSHVMKISKSAKKN
jgi:hypothetical protein